MVKTKEQFIQALDRAVELCRSNSNYMYHYTSASTVINYILKSETLKLGTTSYMNDPEEMSKIANIGLDNTLGDQKSNDMHTLRLYKDMFPELVNAVSFCVDRTDCPEYKGKNFNECGGVFSRKGFLKSRMWAMYAEKHEGICLCFDKSRLERNAQKQFGTRSLVLSQSVLYGNGLLEYLSRTNHDQSPALFRTKNSQFEDFFNHIVKFKDFFFFYKQKDWADEDEHRLTFIHNSINQGDNFLSFQNSLVAIIIGHNLVLGPENMRFLTNYSEQNTIPVYRATFNGMLPSIYPM